MGRDTARCKVSLLPVVKIDADADADSVNAIHHNVGKMIGGNLSYTMADGNDKWIYSAIRSVATEQDLFGTIVSYTDGSASVASGDKIKIVYIKHLGVTSSDEVTTDNIWISIDGSTPTATNANGFILEPNESMILKPTGLTHSNFHSKSSGSDTIKLEFMAILDDVSE